MTSGSYSHRSKSAVRGQTDGLGDSAPRRRRRHPAFPPGGGASAEGGRPPPLPRTRRRRSQSQPTATRRRRARGTTLPPLVWYHLVHHSHFYLSVFLNVLTIYTAHSVVLITYMHLDRIHQYLLVRVDALARWHLDFGDACCIYIFSNYSGLHAVDMTGWAE